MTDIRQQAERRYEREQEELREQAERQKKAEKESGIRSHITAIQRQRDEERKAQARRDAAQEADELAVQRYEIEQRMEQEAMALNRSVAELEALDRRHRDALRQAGQDVGHTRTLRSLLRRWFAHRLGGFNSPSGIIGTHPTGKERTLAERDPLSQAGNRGDVA